MSHHGDPEEEEEVIVIEEPEKPPEPLAKVIEALRMPTRGRGGGP